MINTCPHNLTLDYIVASDAGKFHFTVNGATGSKFEVALMSEQCPLEATATRQFTLHGGSTVIDLGYIFDTPQHIPTSEMPVPLVGGLVFMMTVVVLIVFSWRFATKAGFQSVHSFMY